VINNFWGGTFVNAIQPKTKSPFIQWGTFYTFIADYFASQIIGGAKELEVLL